MQVSSPDQEGNQNREIPCVKHGGTNRERTLIRHLKYVKIKKDDYQVHPSTSINGDLRQISRFQNGNSQALLEQQPYPSRCP
ncbi:hypothetical protein GX50_03888 [[Emmonsia] crescens]|uniref:Uncharacterized protein n=1 Tax=[Emmonsia] crescens TaxID=73230 RepID=A0A2B7ZKD0_9EURO|nr:hypothetical protein GX50_03888 [Emmonsia crescens]